MDDQTAQEAIEYLSELRCGYNCFDSTEEPYYKALSMAISALQEQIQREDDGK